MQRYDSFVGSRVRVVGDKDVLNGLLQTLSVERTRYSEIDVTRESESGEIAAFQADPAEYLKWNNKAKRFGIRYRHVVTPRIARHPAMHDLVPATAGFIEWRVAPRVTTRIHVQANRVLTALDPNDSHVGALVVEGPGATGWKEIAETIWSSARPWSASVADRAGVRTNDVIDLLLQGFDDEAVARRLDISVRTVRRDVADLMVVHGARSRLQLGAALVSGS